MKQGKIYLPLDHSPIPVLSAFVSYHLLLLLKLLKI